MDHQGWDRRDGAQPLSIDLRLKELRRRYGERIPLSEVGALLAAVLASIRVGLSTHELRIYEELEALAHYIERAKSEVSAIRCAEIPARHIVQASGELDAVGSHLEDATSTILDACEQLEATGREAGGATARRITEIVTGIYEACSFQDITGQRIGKVIATLKTIEERIGQLLLLLGHELSDEPALARGPAELLNGPQLPGFANSQADIDALLATFD